MQSIFYTCRIQCYGTLKPQVILIGTFVLPVDWFGSDCVAMSDVLVNDFDRKNTQENEFTNGEYTS